MEPTDWITAGATVVLVLVTCWYAKTTSTISKASVDSADSAKTAAEEAARSAAAAVATVSVGFDLRPTYRFPTAKESEYEAPSKDDQKFNLGVRVTNTGSNLFIHEVKFLMYYRMTKPGGAVRAAQGEVMNETALWEGSKVAPGRIHNGEVSNFWSPAHWVSMGYVAGMAVRIRYSINKIDVFDYVVHWWGQEGSDFDFKSNDLLAAMDPIDPKPSDAWSIRTPGQGETGGVKWKKLELGDLFQIEDVQG